MVFQFVADVGGAAGFMLGVSVATILAVLDFIVAKLFLLLHTIFVALYRQFKCFGYGNGLQLEIKLPKLYIPRSAQSRCPERP